MIDRLFPILNVVDVERSLVFWRDQMGGRVTFSWPGPDGAPVYVGIDLGRSHLGIGGPSGAETSTRRQESISLWVYTSDCDGLVERLRAAGVPILDEPAEQAWGERTARVTDPDGNVVIIGQRNA